MEAVSRVRKSRPVWIAPLLLGLFAEASPPARAGVLEPPGPPGPTFKTLAEIPPTWSRSLGSSDGAADGCNSTRFTCVLDGNAVLDNETGLVWPRSVNGFNRVFWGGARDVCARWSVESRGGWRLASLPELRSLLADLPADAPFTFLGSREGRFWTMTSDANSRLRAWTVGNEPDVNSAETRSKSQLHHYICVRAPGALTEY